MRHSFCSHLEQGEMNALWECACPAGYLASHVFHRRSLVLWICTKICRTNLILVHACQI